MITKSLFAVVLAATTLAFGGCSAQTEDPSPPGSEPASVKSGAHFVGTPTCSQVGNSLECSGSIAGLGNEAVTVDVSTTATCTNRGDHNPPGQVSGTSGPIQPENGRINFDVFVSGGCPSPMTASFSSPALVTVYQGSTLVFSGYIYF